MSSLTRIQFDRACKVFFAKYSVLNGPVPAASGLTGWAWNEHPVRIIDLNLLLPSEWAFAAVGSWLWIHVKDRSALVNARRYARP